MAILSPTIRRSLQRVARSSIKPSSNANAIFVDRRGGGDGASRRTIHSTRVLSVDALDMADTFSRRHREFRSVDE
jgi:hypothetical protein